MGTTNNKAFRRFTTTEDRITLLVNRTPGIVYNDFSDRSRFLKPTLARISGCPSNGSSWPVPDGRR
jgi:hypothetical protein